MKDFDLIYDEIFFANFKIYSQAIATICLRESIIIGNDNGVLKAIRQGADVNFKDTYDLHPLTYAVKYRYPSIVEILLKAKANPNVINARGQSLLMLALDSTPVPQSIEEILDIKLIPHPIVTKFSSKIVHFLLESSIKLSVIDKGGLNIADYAHAINKNMLTLEESSLMDSLSMRQDLDIIKECTRKCYISTFPSSFIEYLGNLKVDEENSTLY